MSIVRQTSTNNLTKGHLGSCNNENVSPHFGPFSISFFQILVIESTVRVERKAFHEKKNFHIENISKHSETVTASLSISAVF